MVKVTKDNLKALLVDADSSVDTRDVDVITLGCSGSCNNAQNMFYVSKLDIENIEKRKKKEKLFNHRVFKTCYDKFIIADFL